MLKLIKRGRAQSPIGSDGGTTQDLRQQAHQRNQLPPDEQGVRVRSKWLVIGGLFCTAVTFVLAIVWDAGLGEDMPTAYVLPLYGVSFGAVAIGGMEYLSRPTRERMDRVERGQLLLVELLPEELQQRYFLGMGHGAEAILNSRTGTEHVAARGSAEVVNLHRRNDRPRN